MSVELESFGLRIEIYNFFGDIGNQVIHIQGENFVHSVSLYFNCTLEPE